MEEVGHTFAAQHQIFYPNRNSTAKSPYLWYDPVFQVQTIDGEEVWRRRHYFVRRAKMPGQYFFTGKCRTKIEGKCVNC